MLMKLVQQNILFRVREEKYRSRIKVLETLAAGTTKENEVLLSLVPVFLFTLFLFRLLNTDWYCYFSLL